MSFAQRAGICGRLSNAGMTTGTRFSNALCGRKKLKYATKSVTKKEGTMSLEYYSASCYNNKNSTFLGGLQ